MERSLGTAEDHILFYRIMGESLVGHQWANRDIVNKRLQSVFDPRQTLIDSTKAYDEWAKIGDYDVQTGQVDHYSGPRVAAETVARFLPDNRETVRIVDVAAGTGLVGAELYKLGFRNIHAVEPSDGMRESARQKNVYRSLVSGYLSDIPTNIPTDSYDCLVSCGAFGVNHLPCSSLYEMIRLVRPGGMIINVTRPEILQVVPEYKDRLEPLIEKLEREGKWKTIERTSFPHYMKDREGVIFVHQVS